MPRHRHSLTHEGFVTGMLGAAAVAIWFLGLDLLRGQPLATPNLLGQVLVLGDLAPTARPLQPLAIVAYTALHLGVFLLLGFAIAELVHLAVRQPLFQFALLMLFMAFEFCFVGVSLMFLAGTGGHFPIWSILGANSLGVVAMGTYLWRRHPALRRQLARVPLGA